MTKNSKLKSLNIKLFLLSSKLKEDKSYNLNPTEKDESLVFIFQDKEALCRFLIDKNIDTSSPKENDIIAHDLIMKQFEDGTIICSKKICQYLVNEARKKVDKNLQNSFKRKNKIKYRVNPKY